MPISTPSLVVLISGSGSNLQAIINAVKNKQIHARLCAVISNRADSFGLQRAKNAGIKTFIIDHRNYHSRENFDSALIERIDECQPDLVILAGFMRILTTRFIQHYADRLLNIHPSLLPKYKGLNTHKRALENAETKHGASIHLVSNELDSGAIVLQAEIPINSSDTQEILAARVLKQEHVIYPLAIALIIDGELTISNNALTYNQKPLTHPLLWQSGLLREQ